MTKIAIELETELYKKLESLAQGFNDTPAQVIARLVANALGNTLEQRNNPAPSNTSSEAEQIYPLAYRVSEAYIKSDKEGRRVMNESLNQLEGAGFHRGSARIYIWTYLSMKKGKNYKMGIRLEVTRYFLAKIKEVDGLECLPSALNALCEHIIYRKECKINSPGLEAIHAEFSAMLKPDIKKCPECGYIFFKNNSWGGLDGHWNAKHAEATNMPYAVAGPMIKSGTYKSLNR